MEKEKIPFSVLDSKNTTSSPLHLCVFVLKLSVKSAKSVWHYHSLFLFFSLYAIRETKTSSLCLKGYSFVDKKRDSLYIYGCDRFFFFYCNILFRKRRCLTYFFFFSFSPPPLSFSFSSLLFFSVVPNTHITDLSSSSHRVLRVIFERQL